VSIHQKAGKYTSRNKANKVLDSKHWWWLAAAQVAAAQNGDGHG
jgi:hypothetical protein